MILKFPTPYPDETFYSWIARYHDQSANGLYKFTALRLYGESPSCAIYGLPSGLNQFCEKILPLQIYSPEEIITNHTLLPYYSSAIPEQRLETVKSRMLGQSSTEIHGKLGTLTTEIKNFQYLRYCPACLEEDTKFIGEPYWHRTHQLPGVLVCPFHGTPTLNSMIDKQAHRHLFYASAIEHAKPNVRQKNIEVDDRLISIAKKSSFLLEKYRNLITSTSYRSALQDRGFNQGKYLNQDMFARAFIKYWSPGVLKSVGAMPDMSKKHWLRRISENNRNGSYFPPLYHVLLQTFLNHQEAPSPIVCTARKHYPCPNPFCTQPESNSASLINTHRKQKSGPLHGTIACQCGFSFSCNIEKENYYTGHVLSYGSVWDNKFKEFIQQGLNIPHMMKAMSVSRRVIIRKALELELKPAWNVKMEKKPGGDKYINDRVSKERKNLLKYMKRHPGHSRTEIKAGMNAGYKFLYRRDKEWLLQQLPAPKKTKPKGRTADWEKRDKHYHEQARSIVRDLLNQPGKPIKITPSIISRFMGKRNLFSKVSLEKIPLTAAYLTEACNDDDYYYRRLTWARDQLKIKGKTLTRSNLIYTACLSYNTTSSLESIIEKILQQSSNEAPYQLPKGRTNPT